MSADASGRVRVPDKRAALKMIADYTAGMISAGTWEEITGLLPSETDRMTGAELRRLMWARDEVQRRLYAMGGR